MALRTLAGTLACRVGTPADAHFDRGKSVELRLDACRHECLRHSGMPGSLWDFAGRTPIPTDESVCPTLLRKGMPIISRVLRERFPATGDLV